MLAEYGTAIPFYLVMLSKGAMIQLWAAQKDLFFSPVVRQPLCFEVLENCSNLTFKSQSLILFAFAKVTSATAMIFIIFNSSSLSCNIFFHISNCSVSLTFAAPLKRGIFWLTSRGSGTGRRAKKTETHTLYIATKT